MEHQQIILFRNLFFRTFVIGVIFALLLVILTFTLWNVWAGWVMSLFRVEEKQLGEVVLLFFTNVRIVLLFFFLAPALALHWTAKKNQPPGV